MAKFCNMTVRVPVDDGLAVEAVRRHLQAELEKRGTETLAVTPRQNSADATQPELAGDDALPREGRIHWPAVEVLQAQERRPPGKLASPTPTPRGGRGRAGTP